MADGLAAATVQVLLEKAISLATDRISLVLGFKKDLESLRSSAAMIRDVLADAEEKQMKTHAVQRWLKRLEAVSFDADNVLDELNYEILRRKVESRNQQLSGKVCCFFSSSSTKIAFRWRMASKVRDIEMKLKRIHQEAHDFGLNVRFQMDAPHPVNAGVTINRQTDSLVGEIVVGRANDESKIVEMLLSSSEKVVSVIPIIGMGGLGKTTLAKLVYNNHRVNRHFDKRIWICVSDKFEGMELFKYILESLTRRTVDMASRDAIVQEIRKELEGKRCLIVLDDVWNDIPALWEDFFHSLVGLCMTNGSWCLVTTRQQQVASVVAIHPPYLLGKLSDDDCWSILKEKATAGGDVPEELNVISKQIIKKCDGLPLAARVIGGLLRMKGKQDWQSIVENRLSNLTGDENGVSQILKLSFDYLPSASIKKCFAYCSIFAKNTEIDRDLLIEHWMAEGFLKQDLKNETVMEEIGDQYFRILQQSSLLEEVKEDWRTYYRMHDLVHDLAESISKPESINLEDGVTGHSYQVRYLALNSSNEITDLKILTDLLPSVRTLFLNSGISDDMLLKFKYLHILNLSQAYVRKLPNKIGNLRHLRYLHLSSTRMETLPESLCKLCNLQTLRIYECRALRDLPKRMSNLISLRHLHYYNGDANFEMPLEMGRLTCLQTLKFFNIGQEKGRQIEELGCLKKLRGSLEIYNLELVNGKEGAERANLCEKKNLLELEFFWGSRNQEGDNYDEDVLEGLQPHPSLQKLVIKNYMGDQFPRWFMNLSTMLEKLVNLSLTECKRCKEIPGLGQLPFLQTLNFRGLENISCLGLSFYYADECEGGSGSICGQVVVSRKIFPALKTLHLENMKNLVEWMDVEVRSTAGEIVDVFPVLESLIIWNCSRLTTAPNHFPSLKELKINSNDHVLVVEKILSKVTTLSSFSISRMAGLTRVSDVLLPKNQNLKHLRLEKCPHLICSRGCGTSLESLFLINCDSLRELPNNLCEFQSLRQLKIQACPRILIPEGQCNFTCLEHLTIAYCNELTNLNVKMLELCPSLRELKVYECPNLVCFQLDLKQITSLVVVWLHKCPNLTTAPRGFGFLTRLREVCVGPFSDDSSIDKFDWSGLMSSSTLRILVFYGLHHMKCLPDQLQYLTNIKELRLYEFGVEALPDWLGNLVSLEKLHLCHCEKLKYLPSMDAMRRLTKLISLQVYRCHLLKERCTPQSGSNSEWSKISHIPERWIN